jgi:peroxiredoxin
MRLAPPCLSALLALAACTSEPESANEHTPRPASRRKEFKQDLASNRETGKPLDGGEEARFVDPQGQEKLLSAWRGKPVVLVFTRGFAGYVCPYCTSYTAQIAQRYQEFTAQGAEVLLVYPAKADDQETKDRFVKAVEEQLAEEGQAGIPFPVFLDPGLAAVKRFNLTGELSKPSTFVLDANGVVTYAYVGSAPDERPSLDRVLKELAALRKAQ